MLAYGLALSVCLSFRPPDADMAANMLGSAKKEIKGPLYALLLHGLLCQALKWPLLCREALGKGPLYARLPSAEKAGPGEGTRPDTQTHGRTQK